jgi:hypothetical protein
VEAHLDGVSERRRPGRSHSEVERQELAEGTVLAVCGYNRR